MICTAISKDFIPGFRALVNSIKMHTKGFDGEFLCLDIDLDEADRKTCQEICKCQFINPARNNYQKLPPHAPALRNAFFKLDFFKEAQRYDKLLLVDSDIIFLDSIQELLDHKPVAEVELVYHASHQEYNTGLILFNRLPITTYRQMIKLMSEMRDAHLADQTVIMKAIQKNIFSFRRLPSKWNTTKRHALQRQGQPRDYTGLHFVGKKPWKGGEEGYEDLEEV
jgi:lipopolysaccharide biosynthesis glycosyltransferase